jgi:hypothetical protein
MEHVCYLSCELANAYKIARHWDDIKIIKGKKIITGFQLYLVEQWLSDRDHFFKSVAVYTGDSHDRLIVSLIQAKESSPGKEAFLSLYESDHSRPIEVSRGYCIVRSLFYVC